MSAAFLARTAHKFERCMSGNYRHDLTLAERVALRLAGAVLAGVGAHFAVLGYMILF